MLILVLKSCENFVSFIQTFLTVCYHCVPPPNHFCLNFILSIIFSGTMSSAAIGIGAIILIGLWSSSFILCLLSLRTRHSIGPIVFICTILITVILLSIPRSSADISKPDNKVCY